MELSSLPMCNATLMQRRIPRRTSSMLALAMEHRPQLSNNYVDFYLIQLWIICLLNALVLATSRGEGRYGSERRAGGLD